MRLATARGVILRWWRLQVYVQQLVSACVRAFIVFLHDPQKWCLHFSSLRGHAGLPSYIEARHSLLAKKWHVGPMPSCKQWQWLAHNTVYVECMDASKTVYCSELEIRSHMHMRQPTAVLLVMRAFNTQVLVVHYWLHDRGEHQKDQIKITGRRYQSDRWLIVFVLQFPTNIFCRAA